MDTAMKSWIFPLSVIVVCSLFFATGVEASADTHLGCYNAYGTHQIFFLDGSTATMSSLTSAGCRETCRQNIVDSFAGILGGTFCYCAQQLTAGQVAKVNDSLCNVSCPGEPTEFCGGSSNSAMLSVYSVCSKGFYGVNCDISCNCKDNASCEVHGKCPRDECAVGWKLNSRTPNIRSCSIDIDECSEKQMSNCSHICTNTNGSYECECLEGFKLEDDGHHCVVVESGLRSLVVGLGMGNGLQAIIIMALAITVCILFARRNSKAAENEMDAKSGDKMCNSNIFAQLDTPQANDCRSHPLNEYDHLDKPKATAGSRPHPAVEYDQLGHTNAAIYLEPNEFCGAVDHPKQNQEDPYHEIA